MSLFRRKRVKDAEAETGSTQDERAAQAPAGDGAPAATGTAAGTADDTAGAAASAPAEEAPAAAAGSPGAGAAGAGAADRSGGPFDASEVPAEDGRLPLGGLRLAGREGMELRFEVEEAGQRVIAVTVGLAGSAVQLQVFAAPRSRGVWDEIRAEIAAAVGAQGGVAEERTGSFGAELLCRLPVRTEDGRTAHQPTRFVGVDGPRWFLRAVFSGPAAHDEQAAAPLEDIVRDVVVVRGTEAMAPRELIPLALPEARPQPPAEQEQAGGREDLKPFERGPEITEVR
ncbi:DUF3710 domain-containing protein [Kineococcus sp. SYSU DK005]|uniref:DUF3710 domain-containing protein n=1 Tax=Kineococcus sp. SYSU DK005 TaxID=3383126 RepID=UPI003D7E7ACD